MVAEQLNKKRITQDNCPFASPTEEATGDWFVGRKKVLEKMTKEIVHGDRVYNYHIVGLPRMGKSSLLKAFQKLILDSKLCQNLVVIYISLDGYSCVEEMWRTIGKTLDRNIQRQFDNTQQLAKYVEELKYECADMSEIDFECVCSIAKSMKKSKIIGLVMIDEFDNFSSLAQKSTVGQLRTLFSAAEYGTRAILASRRTINIIESEVSGAINSNVSTLSPIFINGCTLVGFNKEDMDEYWSSVAKRIGKEISSRYKENVIYYAGNHPYLLNLLNVKYWTEQTSHEYLYEENAQSIILGKDIVYIINNAFEIAVWRDLEKWKLLRPLIILTWGPDINITNNESSILEKYGIINPEQRLSGKDNPIRIAVSRYFTDWMRLKRYCLPFGDEWSMAERNMRSIVKLYCEKVYQGEEDKMVEDLVAKHANIEKRKCNPEFTTKSRFDAMRKRKEQNVSMYPDMSSSIIDYSNPSDLPAIFFTKEWEWFEQAFNGTLQDWDRKFREITKVRNWHDHNNTGIPEKIVANATRYCHDINERIERFIDNDKL